MSSWAVNVRSGSTTARLPCNQRGSIGLSQGLFTGNRHTRIRDPDPAGALHRAVMRPNPRLHGPADVPGGIVPHQPPYALVLRGEPAGTPGQKVRGDAADRAAFDTAQQHPILVGSQQP